MPFDPNTTCRPIFGTQGGGLVEEVVKGEMYRFVEAPPDCPMFQIGDTMPIEWSIVPANAAAWRLLDEDQFGV